MNKPVEREVQKEVDSIQERLMSYACDLRYDTLSPEAIHAVKVRVIDTLGALIGGFFAAPCQIARNVAAQMPNEQGATVIGTRLKTTPDMAAFVNSTTSRYVEANDVYHWPGSFGGHPSDVLTPVLAAAEHAQVSGRQLITGVALAYEVFLRVSDVFHNVGFDHTNFCCIGTAVAAGKMLGLSASQMSHCVSMAVVPNNMLRQARLGHLSMFKAAASGQAGRSGVFAALLARAGMEGPHLPFEGKAGWCDHVAGHRFSLDSMGGGGTRFKIQDTLIKQRTTCATTISSVLAAEKAAAAITNITDVKQVTVEVYKRALDRHGTGEHHWNPDSRETADHSIPYVTASALMYGTVTPSSFNDAQLWNRELRALMGKIEVVENEEFTRVYGIEPQEHRTRVAVVCGSGERYVGEAGGDQGDLADEMSDGEIEDKFRILSEDALGSKRVKSILDFLWNLEDLKNVGAIPPAFVLA